MFHKEAVFTALALVSVTATAYAASGSLDDPKGDYPDIVELAYKNGDSRVVMTATYKGDGYNGRAQSEVFYMLWGSNAQKHYRVVLHNVNKTKGLYFSGNDTDELACDGLRVKRPTARSTKVKVPRGCMPKAPDKLRFQEIATEGLYSVDETKISERVARG